MSTAGIDGRRNERPLPSAPCVWHGAHCAPCHIPNGTTIGQRVRAQCVPAGHRNQRGFFGARPEDSDSIHGVTPSSGPAARQSALGSAQASGYFDKCVCSMCAPLWSLACSTVVTWIFLALAQSYISWWNARDSLAFGCINWVQNLAGSVFVLSCWSSVDNQGMPYKMRELSMCMLSRLRCVSPPGLRGTPGACVDRV